MISQNTKNTTTSKMVNIKTYFRKIVNLWFYSPITNWNLWAKIVSENRQAEIKHVCTQEQCVQRFQIFLNFSLILGKSSTFPGSNKSGGSSSLKAAAALNFQVLGPQCFRHHHLCRARCLQLLFSHRREPVQGPQLLVQNLSKTSSKAAAAPELSGSRAAAPLPPSPYSSGKMSATTLLPEEGPVAGPSSSHSKISKTSSKAVTAPELPSMLDAAILPKSNPQQHPHYLVRLSPPLNFHLSRVAIPHSSNPIPNSQQCRLQTFLIPTQHPPNMKIR